MRKFVWILLGCLALTAAHAASFDCAKARTKVEQMICADPELSKLDEDLDAAYRQALQRPDVKQGIAESQRQWLKRERNACTDAPCLKKAYQNRINELSLGSSFGIVMMRVPPGQMPPPAPAKPAAPPPKPAPMAIPHPKPTIHPAVCQAVVEAANAGKLHTLELTLPEDGLIDINGDGKKERVGFSDGGTMHWQEVVTYTASGEEEEFEKSKEDDWESDNLRWALDKALVKYDGQIYILGMTNDYLLYLSRIGKDDVEKVVCQFAQRAKPRETLTRSTDDALCQLALTRKLDYVTFDRSHNLPDADTRELGPYTPMPEADAALIDIENTGKPELVAKMDIASGAGRGCDSQYLAVLNKAGNEVNQDVTQLLPGGECGGATTTPFIYKGDTYVEVRYADAHPTNQHVIARLKSGKVETVCSFDVRLVQYVQGDYERIIANAKAAYKDPWDYALEQPGTGALQALLDAGQDLRVAPGQGAFGTALHEAIRLKRYDALRFLLDHGADPNLHAEYPFDEPPLIFAVKLNAPEAVKLLMAHGADTSRTSFGQTALQCVDSSIKSESEREAMRKLLGGH